MCLSSPKIPDPPPPPQASQAPDTNALLKSRQAAGAGFGAGGTVLTGSQGLAAGMTNTGANTLLGH